MIRVCYVIPTLGVGGTERQLIHLIRGLAADHEINVVCTRREGALAGEAIRAGAQVRTLGFKSGWDFRAESHLRHIFRTRRPDVIHTFLFGFDLWANRAARAAGLPVVVSSRRQLATWKKRRHVLIQKLANHLVDCIVANSQAVAEFAMRQEDAPESQFRVIHNGIFADDFVSHIDLHLLRTRYRIPFHCHVIGMVANFSPVKDHALFVEAAAALIRRRADVHFLLVGTGPLVATIDRLIAKHDLRECFTHAATTAELPDLYALMDVSVLCSKVEGFPNVVIESMAAGTPVVATDVGGIPEIVQHGVTGRLVTSRNPEDLAAEIDWVLSHPDDSRAMAQRAARWVSTELSMEKMVEGYRALYAELLADAKRKRT
jgi:glycosyltransferase involved in cell wall biosynthesis